MVGFIFARSSKTAEESSEESAHIITLVATIIDHEFEKLPPDEKLEYIDSLQFYVRKFAHFSVYAVLGMLGAATAHFFGLHKLTGLVYSVILRQATRFTSILCLGEVASCAIF